MLRAGRVEASGGFLLALAVLFYFDDQWLLLRVLPACALHEWGHWAAIRLLGGGVEGLRLTAVGAELRLAPGVRLSYMGETAAALAGPAVNLVLAAVCAPRWPVFGGVNLALALGNLLPVLPLDGGRALYCLLAALWSEPGAWRLCRRLSLGAAAAAAAAGGLALWRSGYNFTLLLGAVWLIFRQFRGKRVANRGKIVYNGTE